MADDVVSKKPDPAATQKGAPADYVLTENEAPFAAPGRARALERDWQHRLAGGIRTTRDKYAETVKCSDLEEVISCPLCGCDVFSPLFQPSRKNWIYNVVICDECELLYRNPGIIPEKLHLLYDSVDYNTFLSGDYSNKRQRLYRTVLSSFDDLLAEQGTMKVLDFGCGNGLFLEVAQQLGHTTYGVDLSPTSIEAAKERLGHDRLFCGDPEDSPLISNEKFDFITMWSVLAHLPKPIETLSKLRSLLKPGGMLLVFTVNANSLLLKAQKEQWAGFTRNHLAFFAPSTARRLFKKAGYGEVYIRPHFSNNPPATKRKIPAPDWTRWQRNVLEFDGGNMNRMIAFNGQRRIPRKG